MNNVKVAIIEDEAPAARLLHSMVARLRPAWDVAVLPGNIEEAVRWFASNPHPDLIFLDIHLSDGNSFDFLSRARPSSTIIFTTAYDEYAIRAFGVNSIDYILKPVEEQRLLDAIVKYESLKGNRPVPLDQYMNTVLESLQRREKQFRTRFLIAGADKFHTLEVAEVAYFYSENKITFAVTHSAEQHMVDLPLEKLCDQLDPDRFFRANRQVLLSISSIKRIEPYFNEKVVVLVKPTFKDKITISKEKVSAFKLWLNY